MQGIRLTGVKEFSLQANKSALRSWFKWLVQIGKVEWNPIDLMPAIKLPDVDPKPLPVADTLKILESAEAVMDWKFKERNLAMLEAFYASGGRVTEVINLDVTDLVLNHSEPHFIIRLGKGKKDGIGRLTLPAVDAIKAYLPIRARLMRRWEKSPDSGPLFPSKSCKRLDSKSVWNLVGQVGEKVLKRHVHPHQFRHSFCTDLLNNGADLESIRKMARHKHLSTTQKYLSVSTAHLKEAYDKHPGNRPRKPKGPDGGEEPKK